MNCFKLILPPIACLAILSVAGCPMEDRWSGYIYPDKGNLADSKLIGEFSSLVDCRDEANDELKKINAVTDGDYECGLNCEDSVCEETSK